MNEAKPPGSHPPERLTLQPAEQDPAVQRARTRESTGAALRLGRQRSEAAETLWVAGHGAEALDLARRALEATLEGASSIDRRSRGVSLPPPPPGQEAWTQLLRKRLRPGELEALHAVRAELREMPVHDADVDASHARLFRRTQRIRSAVDRALTPLTRTPKSARVVRLRRFAIGLAIGLALLGGALALFWPTSSLDASVEASGAYLGDPRYAGSMAFDGDPRTEWQLDDRQRGWVERRFSTPVAMRKVSLRNGHNAHWMDRGVRGYRLELYDARDREVHRLRASFAAIEENPQPRVHVLPRGLPPIGRLRVVVESYFELGASLAEVSWEPASSPARADSGAYDVAPADAGTPRDGTSREDAGRRTHDAGRDRGRESPPPFPRSATGVPRAGPGDPVPSRAEDGAAQGAEEAEITQ